MVAARCRLVVAVIWMLSLVSTRSFCSLCTSGFRRSSLSLLRAASSSRTAPAASSSRPKEAAVLQVPTVLLKRTRQSKAFRNGNQLVFTRAIRSITDDDDNNNLQTADLVRVAVEADEKKKPLVVLGWGVYNPDSLYKVRILCHRYVQPVLHRSIEQSVDSQAALEAILRHHLRTAVAARRALNLPNEDTDTYRLVSGEGDGLSGLAVDVIQNVAVIMSSASWCQIHRETIEKAVSEVLPADTELVWKTTDSRLRQDGYSASTIGSESEAATEFDPSHMILSKENGIGYKTFPFADGQKTGVYCDQRENRLNLAALCKDKRVLDLCCYHGGFSLNAVVNGGAASAVGVDSSEDAVQACWANAELNQCQDKVDFVRADITSFLQESFGKTEYDVVVLDPPKLAPNANALDKARRKYHALNRDAIKVVSEERGGLLLTCTCSAAMTQKEGGQYFINMVHGAALAAGRQVTLLRVSGAASCHTQSPASWPAGAYLTAALFHVHPL